MVAVLENLVAAGARAPEHGRQDEGAHGAAALFGGAAVRHADRGGARLLDSEAGVHRLLCTDPTGSKFLTYAIISEIVGILVIRKIANPRFEDAMLTNLFFFLLAFATLATADLVRHASFSAARKIRSATAWRSCNRSAMVRGRARRRGARRGGGFSNGLLYLVSLVPGGDDWLRGHRERMLNQAGIRERRARRRATSLFNLAVHAALLGGMLWLQRDNRSVTDRCRRHGRGAASWDGCCRSRFCTGW